MEQALVALSDQGGAHHERQRVVHRRERAAHRAQVLEIGRRYRSRGAAGLRVGAPDHHQPIGVVIGQRLQEHGAHDAQDGAVGADAEGQRGRGQGGEAARRQERPHRRAQIAEPAVPLIGPRPGRRVEMRPVAAPREQAHDGGSALREPVRHRADDQREAGEWRAFGGLPRRLEVAGQLGAEMTPERARVGGQRDPYQPPRHRGHARPRFADT